jgi:hypothetical protein
VAFRLLSLSANLRAKTASAMPDEFADSLRSAFLEHLRGRHVVVRTPRFPATSYPLPQLKRACLLAAVLQRGDLVLLEEPEDG